MGIKALFNRRGEKEDPVSNLLGVRGKGGEILVADGAKTVDGLVGVRDNNIKTLEKNCATNSLNGGKRFA